ncbi:MULTISPECIES: FecR domain-containing protein [unclassified Rhizobium]|uniref:FecR domain-containing protein n=1 Tax=unclassified Rhizobium TaxID=2613769 RepID=UPI000701400F|nr:MULTISPECIES: FecR domain-containing protein [unclassified Rhizobium]KQV44491.1 TonB-dependent receptor [Rhizobium sp. Root1212]KRD38672.1 TonB-dependent receptor [Rhizobium sp. Root268]
MKRAPIRQLSALALLCLASTATAEPLPRNLPAAGSVIARKAGEEVRFVDVSNWRYVDLQQDLLTGDVLRTNANGQLAVLFADRTQVRLGRNTSLLVKSMRRDGDTDLELQSGTIWARAERGGQGLTVDTPAAAAAIRGTDWTLTVGADGKTSLIVLEGKVELKNDFGSVEVSQGEGAVASIGKAPTKIIIAKPKEREQMLFSLQLRDSFRWMPPTTMKAQEQRQSRDRIAAEPADSRSAEDWLVLAEASITLEGRQKTREALEAAKAKGLNRSQRARVTLMEAMMAGSENRYADAAKLFAEAQRGLDPHRANIARYGGFIARSLADPNHIETPPEGVDSASAAIGKAWITGFRDDVRTALDVVKAAERDNPDDAMLPAGRAQLAILLADEAEAKDAIDRALTLDPENPAALDARATYKMGIAFDRKGAIEDLLRAAKAAPGDSGVWNTLGLAYSDRDDNRKAEEAYKRAIELDPLDPLPHANLAILYLDEMRMEEAKREIDLAIQVDPSFDMVLLARGRYHIQMGEIEKGTQDLLAASASNPGVSQTQLLLAAALYARKEREPTAQALDNAERLDPYDPIVPVVRTAIAIDEYDADTAIRNAQEIMRLTRARGGDYAALGANQTAGSTLNDAFRLQGLDAWGQYYGDAVFDPFTATSYFDQAVRGSISPFLNTYSTALAPWSPIGNQDSYSAYIQGLMLGPHMLASRERTTNLLDEPFFETELTGGFLTGGRETTYTGGAEIRGFTYEPFPISIQGDINWSRPRDEIDVATGDVLYNTDITGGNGYVTMSPTPDDRIVAFTSYASSDSFRDDPSSLFYDTLTQDNDASELSSGLAWSHTFGYQNVLNAGLFYNDQRIDSRTDESGITFTNGLPAAYYGINLGEARVRSYTGAVSHMIGDDDLTWRYGVEGSFVRSFSSSKTGIAYDYYNPFPDGIPDDVDYNEDIVDTDSRLARAYIDARYEITQQLTLEAAAFGRFLNTDDTSISRFEPRIGLAWSPLENHWLRFGYMREGENFSAPTLAPIGVVGLQSNQIGLNGEGYVDTVAFRWDAQWNDRFFTAFDYQRQEAHKVSLVQPLEVSTLDFDKARIDRAALTANLALGHGLGLSATYAHLDSKNLDPITGGGSLVFVPDQTAEIALTWVNTADIKMTLAANYVGERAGDNAGAVLDDYWTLDAALQWEPFDKQIELELSAYNLLDEDFELAPGVKGWGPTVKGTLSVRF